MKEIVKFSDWAKLELRVGEVVDTKGKTIINCGRNFTTGLKLNISKGDKIVIGLSNGGLIIPLLQSNIIIVPEKDIETGSRVG
ncbi:MAG: hypothetical protein AABW51_04595 [Nanoarchaeota archaeon]